MRSMGVHATKGTLWLACVDEEGPVDIGGDYRRSTPSGLESGPGLESARDDLARVIGRHGVTHVWLLSAESSARFKYAYAELVERITMETVLAFAAASRGVDFARVSRQRVRTVLALPASGSLDQHTGVVDRVSPHWGPNKRDLAALTALAAHNTVAEASADE